MVPISLLAVATAAPPAAPADPPTHGVVLSFEAYGAAIVGHVLVDTEKLRSSAGLSLQRGPTPLVGPRVPLADGVRILGLPQGERLVSGAIDTMTFLDANGDGYLDPLDPAFGALLLFVDRNADAVVQPAEVRTFAEVGIDSVSRYGSIRIRER